MGLRPVRTQLGKSPHASSQFARFHGPGCIIPHSRLVRRWSFPDLRISPAHGTFWPRGLKSRLPAPTRSQVALACEIDLHGHDRPGIRTRPEAEAGKTADGTNRELEDRISAFPLPMPSRRRGHFASRLGRKRLSYSSLYHQRMSGLHATGFIVFEMANSSRTPPGTASPLNVV